MFEVGGSSGEGAGFPVLPAAADPSTDGSASGGQATGSRAGETARAGAALASELAVVELVGSTDDGLIDVIRGWERLVAWAQAGQLAAVAEFARRRSAGSGKPPKSGEPPGSAATEFTVDELAAALRLSRVAAGVRLHLAVELDQRLAGTAAALASGAIDLPKTRAVVDATGPLDRQAAAAVEVIVLPRAVEQTASQLRAGLARAVLAVDPGGAEVRHQRAVADRRVEVTPVAEGMAELWALLPADAAVAVYGAVDAQARAEIRDDRPMDARRADALVALVTGSAPAELSSASPAARGGPVAGGGMAGGGPVAAGGGVAGGVPVAGSDSVAAVGGVAAGASTGAGARRGPLVQVTVPASTLLGVDDTPGEVAGYGPVPASMARRIAAEPTGRWRRILTDPATGAVLDIGRRTYRPPPALARHVVARDGTCRFPGCRQPAYRCDLDHVRPWPDGPTSAGNLITLCRRHHRLKHAGRWQVHVDPDGTLTWTAPTGHTYRTRPAAIGPPTVPASE